jgi:hypothetical protein
MVFCVATMCNIVGGYRRIDLTMDAICSSETIERPQSELSYRLQNLKPYIHNAAY